MRALFDEERPRYGPDLLEDRSRLRGEALALLRMADLGVRDVAIVESPAGRTTLASGETTTDIRRSVWLVHDDGGDGQPLPFDEESAGTRTWYRTIGSVLPALSSGSILVFDELDASLHPTLAAHLLGIFADRRTNPKGAQLIFSSHDTSLLAHLNRDEVWLTEKRKNGSTRLGALSDFAGERVRRSAKLESAYLHGKFGALPDIDQTDFLRSLGLIG